VCRPGGGAHCQPHCQPRGSCVGAGGAHFGVGGACVGPVARTLACEARRPGWRSLLAQDRLCVRPAAKSVGDRRHSWELTAAARVATIAVFAGLNVRRIEQTHTHSVDYGECHLACAG